MFKKPSHQQRCMLLILRRENCESEASNYICLLKAINPRDFAGACSGGNFVVSRAREAHDAQSRGLSRKFRLTLAYTYCWHFREITRMAIEVTFDQFKN